MTNETYRFSADLFRTVYRFASKEKGRYYLHGVCVQQAPKGQPGVVLVATDGHKLIVGYDPKGQAPEGQGVILRTEGHKVPGSNFRDNTKLGASVERVAIVDTSKRGAGDTYHASLVDCLTDKEGKQEELPASAHMFELVDGTFPDWARIIPNFGNCPPVDSASIFNAKQLKVFCDAASDFQRGARTPAISVWAMSPADPALVTFGTVLEGGRDLFGVLMPIRSEAGEGADRGKPDWTIGAGKPAIATEETVTLEAEPLKVAA